MSSDTVSLDLGDIQGTVLRGYRMPVSAQVFLTFLDTRAARAWVASVVDPVTSAAPWEARPSYAVNVGFSADGLRALGVPAAALTRFPTAFTQGMAARSALLGDVGASSPASWQDGWATDRMHAVVLVAAQSEALLTERLGWLAGTLSAGVTEQTRQESAVLSGAREHFGFADGFAQPDVEGLDTGPRHALGVYAGGGRWRPIRAGEFVLGYLDEAGVVAGAGLPEELGRNGSYLVVRKLEQDVGGFRRQLTELSASTGLEPDLIAAKMVGRWPDGTPVGRPRATDGSGADTLMNDFDYSDDPGGGCPVGAHIRRANPRLSMPFEGKLVNRHRVVRRGMPYGRELPLGAVDDGVERGLMFACFQADIERQFEFVQGQWFADGNAFGLGPDKDPLLGDHHGSDKFTVNGAPPSFAGPLRRLVTLRGGGYYFMPGIAALTHLAG